MNLDEIKAAYNLVDKKELDQLMIETLRLRRVKAYVEFILKSDGGFEKELAKIERMMEGK